MGDEPLVATDDPGEVADAGRLAGLERERQCQPRRIAQGLRRRRPLLELVGGGKSGADALGLRQIEAEEVAGVGIVGDAPILHTHRRTNER
jgi:hypothetical protein